MTDWYMNAEAFTEEYEEIMAFLREEHEKEEEEEEDA